MTNPIEAGIPGVDDEHAVTFADRDWWREAGNVIDLELRGWTYRNHASFADRESGASVELTGKIAQRLRSLSSRLQAAEKALEWQDISTAPKDGSEFLASDGNEVVYAVWLGSVCAYDWKGASTPTHWRPLPTPPAALANKGDGDA